MDTRNLDAFLLTFRVYKTPIELFDILERRYCSNIRNFFFLIPFCFRFHGAFCALDPQSMKLVRLRCVNLLKRWILRHWEDFEEDPDLKERLVEFTVYTIGIQVGCNL